MNQNYLEMAKERIPNIPLLINVVSQRVKKLNAGERPLSKPDDMHMPRMELALKEIAEGKLTAEISYVPVNRLSDPNSSVVL